MVVTKDAATAVRCIVGLDGGSRKGAIPRHYSFGPPLANPCSISTQGCRIKDFWLEINHRSGRLGTGRACIFGVVEKMLPGEAALDG